MSYHYNLTPIFPVFLRRGKLFVFLLSLLYINVANALIDVNHNGQSITLYTIEYIGSNKTLTAFFAKTEIDHKHICFKILIHHLSNNISISKLPYCLETISEPSISGDNTSYLEALALNVVNAHTNGLYNLNVSNEKHTFKIEAYKTKNTKNCNTVTLPKYPHNNQIKLIYPTSEVILKISSNQFISVARLLFRNKSENLDSIYQISICKK